MAADSTRTVDVNRFGYLDTGDRHTDFRARAVINRAVSRRFDAERDAWSASNTGQLRTRTAIRFEIALELALLAEALGAWAHVRGDELFPTPLHPERGYEP